MTYDFIGTESVKRKTVQPRATEAEDLIAFIQELIFFLASARLGLGSTSKAEPAGCTGR